VKLLFILAVTVTILSVACVSAALPPGWSVDIKVTRCQQSKIWIVYTTVLDEYDGMVHSTTCMVHQDYLYKVIKERANKAIKIAWKEYRKGRNN